MQGRLSVGHSQVKEVDQYLRQANAARELASASDSELVRLQYEKVASLWEQLAKERLALLQLQVDALETHP